MENTANRRVLYICHDGDLYGSQQSLALIVQRAFAYGVQPFVSIARSGPLNDRLTDIPEVTVLSHQRLQWVKHDTRGFFQKLGDIIGLGASLFPRSLKLARQIQEHKIELVHTNSMVSLEGAVAARLAGVPHVWHVRELFMEENPKLNMVLGRQLTRWLIHHLSDRVICNSRAVSQQFDDRTKTDSSRYQVIYNAVSLAESSNTDTKLNTKPKPAKSPFIVGYVGRLSAGKRFQDLIEALGILKNQGLNIELYVAGRFVDSAFEVLITEQIQRLGLQKQVIFLGYVTALESVYQSLGVLALPSLNEPFGRVLIEAMLQDVPCVAANSGGVPEIIAHEENGLLYPPKNPTALAAALERIMNEPTLRKNLRNKAGRVVRERFTIEAQMKSLVECYNAVFKQKNTPIGIIRTQN